MKLPSIYQIPHFWKVFSGKEKRIFLFFLILFLVSTFFLSWQIFFKYSEKVPAEGGEFVEGILGFPNFLNPLYSFYSPIDETIVDLIFCSLFSANSQGKIVPQVAKSYEIFEQGKIFEVELKDNVFWHDGKKLTADDVVFTIKLFQNPKSQYPLRRIFSQVDVEKIADYKVRFSLKEPDVFFLENLQFKILPSHILEKIPPEQIFVSEFNENPVGCGPFRVQKVKKDKGGKIVELVLKKNDNYFLKKPYLKKIKFLFFSSQQKLERAAKKGKIDGALGQFLSKKPSSFKKVSFVFPKFYGLFFNLENEILAKNSVRKAISFAIDRERILKEALNQEGEIVNSLVLFEFYEKDFSQKNFSFDPQKTKEILEKEGFSLSPEGIFEKEEKVEKFEFKRDLKLGDKGEDVARLQECLGIEVSSVFGEKTKEAVVQFQEKYKDEILKPQGLEKGTGKVAGLTRQKLNQVCFQKPPEKKVLSFELVTLDDEKLLKVAQLIKDDLQKVGIRVEILKFDISAFEREILPQKKYDLLLFGENLGLMQNLFPFWHSLQAEEFGLNLSNYHNEKLDVLLETLKKEIREEERKKIVKEIHEILIEDLPALPLALAKETYYLKQKFKMPEIIKIVSLGKRFVEIENWYQKEKRKILWKEALQN